MFNQVIKGESQMFNQVIKAIRSFFTIFTRKKAQPLVTVVPNMHLVLWNGSKFFLIKTVSPGVYVLSTSQDGMSWEQNELGLAKKTFSVPEGQYTQDALLAIIESKG